MKASTDLVELAQARTALRQVRDEWTGRCPIASRDERPRQTADRIASAA